MPKKYMDFIKGEFENHPYKHNYKSFEDFASNYIMCNGFSNWLDTMQDQSLPLEICEDIANSFITYGGRKAVEIKTILSSISRQYNADIPLISGILTSEYWTEHFEAA